MSAPIVIRKSRPKIVVREREVVDKATGWSVAEWQVVSGSTIVSRHDLKAQAIARARAEDERQWHVGG